ncbi:radical SAM protein [Dechloromonas denitrificans]|uniref:radical SAM protein n=1 Tax=Dechloromonas denitrificans TaxID=281362 RepID=UPI001CF824CD|nr:radical SAM protein [Dechloromonas denitrificans]UCV04581.1 SPASM domain-containing protein [Dechloromonas denitrificans]
MTTSIKAKDISGQAPGGTRQRLAQALPLDTPYVVQIFPVYACNFKCGYCLFSVDKAERGFISDTNLIDFELYRKCVDDMTHFPNKLKVLRFVGIGEPLLHKKIIEMVAYTVDRQIAQTVEIVTNGVLLDKRIVDGLVGAGLTRLVISIQGTGQEKYFEVAGARIDFDKFIDNLAYLWANKGDTHVYIKIIDTALKDEADRAFFFEKFGGLCDSIAVENTVPIHKAIDFSQILGKKGNQLTQFGLPMHNVAICPQPFFHLQINPDGKVVPCYSWDYPAILGDCNHESVTDIWNGPAFAAFRRAMLEGVGKASPVCVDCNIIKYRWFPEDDLSADAERLKAVY